METVKSMSIDMPVAEEPLEPSTRVLAGESGKAVLPCPVSRPSNDSIDLILWFRGDAETALYSLDARSGPIQRARHFPSDDLSTRAYIDITGR
ncbi:sidestep protein-like protein [Leptotrombidium deliense]|uniref:Sidestep protein-like protein n=1 Tax=Leptotrombidium deliense TaxID=299467 RepID=A0A443SPT9_9ACAR|nr:sidestep protein-like protein [Leptotrombidium deliense]